MVLTVVNSIGIWSMGVVVEENSLHEQADVASRERAIFDLVASLAFRQAAVKGSRAVSDY